MKWVVIGKLLLLLLFTSTLFFFISRGIKEAFGFSNGTLIQLATSHVPTQREQDAMLVAYTKQVNHDLLEMTGAPL